MQHEQDAVQKNTHTQRYLQSDFKEFGRGQKSRTEDINAKLIAAECYLKGDGIKKDINQGLKLLEDIIEKNLNNPIVELKLAMLFLFCKEIEQNRIRAIEWFKKVISHDLSLAVGRQSEVQARTMLGICYYYEYKDNDLALECFSDIFREKDYSERHDSVRYLWLAYIYQLKNKQQFEGSNIECYQQPWWHPTHSENPHAKYPQQEIYKLLCRAASGFFLKDDGYNYTDLDIIDFIFPENEIISFLDHQRFSEAKVILAFYYQCKNEKEKSLALLNEAASQNDILGYYLLGKHYKDSKAFDEAIIYLKKVIDNSEKQTTYKNDTINILVQASTKEIADIEKYLQQIEHESQLNKLLEEKNKELEKLNEALKSQIEETKKANKIAHEKEKEMLSFFTHTMRNALATAPESLRQAIRLLGSEDYEKNQKHYEAINEITALFSTLSLTDCLIDTFKQSIYDTEEFKRAWQNDNTGEATPQWFIAAALRQSLNRIIFMSNTRELRKLLNNDSVLIKPTRKAFIEQVLPLDINKQGVESFYQWLNSLAAIDISIEENTVQFGVNQIKFSLLFSITSELILNALKYWSGTGQIQIRWYKEQDYYIFTVKNACRKNASSNVAGTNKGLAFIKRLMELLGEQAYFTPIAEDLSFTAELKLHKTLLENHA